MFAALFYLLGILWINSNTSDTDLLPSECWFQEVGKTKHLGPAEVGHDHDKDVKTYYIRCRNDVGGGTFVWAIY
jgi:hypothetical protein